MLPARVIIVAAFLLLPFCGCYSQEKQAQSQTEKYVWDFGRVKEGENVKHEFVFKNETNKVLNIKDINSSCGCTVGQVKNKILQPQSSTTIEVEFKSKGYSGSVTQYIYINTDNLDNPVFRLIIKALVEK